jgi:hypothetical protein
MARPKTLLSDEQRALAERMMRKGESKRVISRRLRISHHTLSKFFPEYSTEKSKPSKVAKSPKPKKEVVLQYSPSDKKINPLYDPARDGKITFPSLTAKLLRDPPPGRRELLEQWRQNSKSKQVSLSEEV